MTLVTGRCVDASGTGVPGVYVYAQAAAGTRFGRAPATHTDLAGRWSLSLTPGLWTVRETGCRAREVRVAEHTVDLDPDPSTLDAPTPDTDAVTAFMRRRRG